MTVLDDLLGRVGGAAVEAQFPPATVDVPLGDWAAAVAGAKELGASFFDFLSAVDEPDGIRVVCHLAKPAPFEHLVLRTVLDNSCAVASVVQVFQGAAWHERETAEMFGVRFLDEKGAPLELAGLLLSQGAPEHPLRKGFTLQARAETPWPGQKEPT